MRTTIERARLGDEAARRKLAVALWPRLQSMSRHYARLTHEDAEDLLGEAWCAVFDALEEIDMSVGEPVCYLVQRARWRMLDYLKWARRRQHQCIDDHPPVADHADVPEAVAVLAQLADLLASLTDTQRIILVRILRGETWREIAASLGCSAANVAYHMRQVRRRWEEVGERQPQAALGG